MPLGQRELPVCALLAIVVLLANVARNTFARTVLIC
jgi:hypothetical protein